MNFVAHLPLAAGLLLTGAFSGVFAGLLGVGGGAVIVPALALTLSALGYDVGVVQHVAVGTSLAVIIPTGIMSARAHYARGAVDLPALRLWVPVIFVGTLAGGLMAGLYPGNVLRAVLGFMSLFIAANVMLPFQQRLGGYLQGSSMAHRISALVVGYICALMGTGGGALSVPILVAFGLSMHKAVGTGAAIGVAIALAGTLGFVISGWNEPGLPPQSLGYVNLVALVLMGVAAGLTAPLGAALAHRLDAKTLKHVFAGFLILVGLEMLRQAFSH